MKENDKLIGEPKTNIVYYMSPVFVVGGARSGTSILTKLLRDYLHISFGTESQFIIRYYRRLKHYGDLKSSKKLIKLLADIGEERCFKRWQKFGYEFDLNRIYNRININSYSGVLDAIFSDLSEHNGMARWGDKTPEYIYHLDVLKRLFPNAKFIHIVRDGRDIALSTFYTHFGAKNLAVAAMDWKHKINCVTSFKHRVGDGQLIEIRYEDMLNDPIEIFMNLMKFIEVDDDGKLRRVIEQNLADELKRNNFNKWKKILTLEDQIMYEKIAHECLKKYHYETITMGERNISSIEKYGWLIDNYIKKVKRPDYWQDNIYKLKLRIRHFRNTYLIK